MKATFFLMVQSERFRHAGAGYTFLTKQFDLPIAPFLGLEVEEDGDDLDWLTVVVERITCKGNEVICSAKDKIITDEDERTQAIKLYRQQGWNDV